MSEKAWKLAINTLGQLTNEVAEQILSAGFHCVYFDGEVLSDPEGTLRVLEFFPELVPVSVHASVLTDTWECDEKAMIKKLCHLIDIAAEYKVQYMTNHPEPAFPYYDDPERIGCMGLSFGGTMTTYLTLLDERIKAADIICYATTTGHYAINRPNFCGSQLVPYLYKYADVGDVMAGIAPKPLLIESGASDTCFYLHSARATHQIVKEAYRVAEMEDNLWIEVFPGEHSFSGRKAFDFFEKFLL